MEQRLHGEGVGICVYNCSGRVVNQRSVWRQIRSATEDESIHAYEVRIKEMIKNVCGATYDQAEQIYSKWFHNRDANGSASIPAQMEIDWASHFLGPESELTPCKFFEIIE